MTEQIRTEFNNILIVDDDPDTCTLLANFFGLKGYDTTVAYGGREAISCVEAKEPNIVILDVMMPEMDGWETYLRLSNVSNVPVLFLSAMTAGENATRALQMGACDYVRKPFHPEELLARIEAVDSKSVSNHFHDTEGNKTRLCRPTVSVVIPTLNEEENLQFVLPHLPLDWIDEVILVDGLSTDGTVEVAKNIMPSIKIILESRPGKGAALRRGFAAANGDIVITLDADGSTDPSEIPAFIGALIAGGDYVKGSRFVQGGGTEDMPRYRRIGNAVLVHIANLLFRLRYTDITYGFNATWRKHAEDLAFEFDGWPCEIITNIRARNRGLKVIEVACHEHERISGNAKLEAFSAGWEILKAIIRERLRPDANRAHEKMAQKTKRIE